MTTRELSQLYYLNREIERDKEQLRKLKTVATCKTAKIAGLPHLSGISNKTAIAAEIADVETIIEAKVNLSVVEYNRLNRYIASIDDSLIRQIISLRFVSGFSWRAVAYHIGGGNTEDGVRVAIDRFMKSE